MRRAVKRAGVLVAASALAAIALPGTASADVPKWFSDPSSCTNVVTVAEKTSGDRFLQLRKGFCGRSGYYVWARANGNYRVELGVWEGTDNIGSNSTQNGSGSTHYTQGRRIDSGLWFAGDTSWASPISWG